MAENDGWSKLMHWITREGILAKMRGAAPKVYMAMLSYTNGDFKDVWPSRRTLQEDTGLGKDTVDTAIKNLIELKLISKVSRSDSVKGSLSNIYALNPHFEGGVKTSPQGGAENRLGGGEKTRQGEAQKFAPNKNDLTRSKITTTTQPLKRETIIREYETEQINLSDAVVTILKELEIDLNKAPEKFKSMLPDTDVDKLKFYFDEAMKADSPSGRFIDAVANNYPISKSRERQVEKGRKKGLHDAFMTFCDEIKRKHRVLTAKDGQEYEITSNTSAPLVLKDAEWAQKRITTQAQFDALF